MPIASEKQTAVWLDERHLDYHRRQFAEPYRSTVKFGEFVARMLANQSATALDVGCGAGANIFHLGRTLPEMRWTGVDIASYLFEIGREAMKGANITPELIQGDFLRLTELLPAHSFDAVFSIQTVSWLPGYDEFMQQLLAMVKPGGWAFVTSLFTEFQVDARTEITEYAEDGNALEPMFYNIYSCRRFEERCLQLGAKQVIWETFQMDVDLPLPTHGRMGTYTHRGADGRLLQLSGPLLMPWRFAAVRMDL
jgi:ubiquinone/menaquinone biosynthesis C-methylase UbiE